MKNTQTELDNSLKDKLLDHFGREEYIWVGRFRHSTKMHCYVIAGILFILSLYFVYSNNYIVFFILLVFAISIVIMALHKIYTNTFEVTTKRLKIKQFRLFKTLVHYIEYYEITNSVVELYGNNRGHIIFETSNKAFPKIKFPRMENAPQKIDLIRELIEDRKTYMEHMDKQGHLRDGHCSQGEEYSI